MRIIANTDHTVKQINKFKKEICRKILGMITRLGKTPLSKLRASTQDDVFKEVEILANTANDSVKYLVELTEKDIDNLKNDSIIRSGSIAVYKEEIKEKEC